LLHERNYTRISDFAAMRMNRLSITWVKMIAISNQVNPHQVKKCHHPRGFNPPQQPRTLSHRHTETTMRRKPVGLLPTSEAASLAGPSKAASDVSLLGLLDREAERVIAATTSRRESLLVYIRNLRRVWPKIEPSEGSSCLVFILKG